MPSQSPPASRWARARSLSQRAQFPLRLWAQDNLAVFALLMRVRNVLVRLQGGGTPRPLSDRTNLVIEGFPRSANTYTAIAFYMVQVVPPRSVDHTHAVCTVRGAVARGIPVVLLYRHPDDACLSLVIREPQFTLAEAYRYYHHFYQQVLPDAPGCVLAAFPDVTRDMDTVIARVNWRYGTAFATGSNHRLIQRRIRRRISGTDERYVLEQKDHNVGALSVPTAAKERLKAAERARLAAPELAPLQAQAAAIFAELELVYRDQMAQYRAAMANRYAAH